MSMTLLNSRWRQAERADIKVGTRVMLRSGRKGSIASIYLESPLLVMVNVDGRLPTDPATPVCQHLSDLRVQNDRSTE